MAAATQSSSGFAGLKGGALRTRSSPALRRPASASAAVRSQPRFGVAPSQRSGGDNLLFVMPQLSYEVKSRHPKGRPIAPLAEAVPPVPVISVQTGSGPPSSHCASEPALQPQISARSTLATSRLRGAFTVSSRTGIGYAFTATLSSKPAFSQECMNVISSVNFGNA